MQKKGTGEVPFFAVLVKKRHIKYRKKTKGGFF